MSTAPNKPTKHTMSGSEGSSVTPEQLRRDRISLAVVFAIFAGLVALMIWLATISPPGNVDYIYPMIP
jgi:hypothetical protein